MTTNGNGHTARIHLLATGFCGIIGLAGIIAETLCRFNRIDGPLSFSTLVGVCVGALAGAVPSTLNPSKPPST